MSPGLRIAGDWQFGSALLPVIAFAVKGPYWGIPLFAFLSFVAWLGLSSARFASSRLGWWAAVAAFTFAFAFVGLGFLFSNSS
jgi:hypothetical protein